MTISEIQRSEQLLSSLEFSSKELTQKITSLLLTQSETKWVAILKKCSPRGEYLAEYAKALFQRINVQIPAARNKMKEVFSILEEKRHELSGTASTLYSEVKERYEKALSQHEHTGKRTDAVAKQHLQATSAALRAIEATPPTPAASAPLPAACAPTTPPLASSSSSAPAPAASGATDLPIPAPSTPTPSMPAPTTPPPSPGPSAPALAPANTTEPSISASLTPTPSTPVPSMPIPSAPPLSAIVPLIPAPAIPAPASPISSTLASAIASPLPAARKPATPPAAIRAPAIISPTHSPTVIKSTNTPPVIILSGPATNSSSSSSSSSSSIASGGIVNLGATCWLNTLIQLLRNNAFFKKLVSGDIHFFKTESAKERSERIEPLLLIQSLLIKVIDSKNGVSKTDIEELLHHLEASNFIKHRGQMHDAPEVLARLIGRFTNGLIPIKMIQIEQIKHAEGELQVEINCAEQSHYLPLNVTKNEQSVKDVLDSYFAPYRPERIDHDRFYRIAQLPQMIQCCFNRVGGTLVMSEQIDLSAYLQRPPEEESVHYQLESVMCRPGQSNDNCSGGHFRYYQKKGASWTCYDDATVTPDLSFEQIQEELNKFGYACFFSKIDLVQK